MSLEGFKVPVLQGFGRLRTLGCSRVMFRTLGFFEDVGLCGKAQAFGLGF